MTDRNEQRYLASMFCWNMAIEADRKCQRCFDAGDVTQALRHMVAYAHYMRNYRRLQFTDK